MISFVFFLAVSVVLLLILLWVYWMPRPVSGTPSTVLSYDHELNLHSFLRTQALDLEFLPTLFRKEDFSFLQSLPQAGVEARRLKHGRLLMVRDFLIQLQRDFEEVVYVHHYLARHAEQLSAQYEWRILRESLRFRLLYAWTRFTLRTQFAISIPKSGGILALAKALEGLSVSAEEKCGLLTPSQLTELRSTLQIRLLQSEIS